MKSLWVAVVLLSACGESSEERICGAANGCGALATANVEACVDTLSGVDADRALEECADCLEAKTCAEIAGGACAPNCSAFGDVLNTGPGGVVGGIPDSTKLRDLDQEDATTLCHELADTNPRRSVECTIDGRKITVVAGVDRARCGSFSAPDACNATVGQARDCSDEMAAISDSGLCALSFPAVCEALVECDL